MTDKLLSFKPYKNLPESDWDKMDRCVNEVMDKQGVDKQAAIAICYTSVSGKENKSSNPFFIDLANEIVNWISEKAGARHSGKDQESLQKIHDHSVELGASCPAMIFKEESGKYRWVTFSSSTFQDRDREIVSLKAQQDDIDRMTANNDYGVLRWWHVGKPVMKELGKWQSYVAGDGIDLGTCDFSAMEGKVRIESGIFYDNNVGAKFAEHSGELAVSTGFAHPFNQPDSEGAFYDIKSFERSLLPKDKQSNYLAFVPIIARKENSSMDETKLKKLKELLGDDVAQTVLKQANVAEKAAEGVGLKFKAAKKQPLAEEGTAEEEAAESPEEEDAEVAKGEGDMPMKKKKEASEITDEITEVMTELKELKQLLSASLTTKEQQAIEVEELKVALKEAQESNEAVTAALASVQKVQANHGTVLKELVGDLPKSLKGFRASEDDETVTTDETKLKQMPQSSPINDFFSFAATGQVQR